MLPSGFPAAAGWTPLRMPLLSVEGKITLVTFHCTVPKHTVALRFRFVPVLRKCRPNSLQTLSTGGQSVSESRAPNCLVSLHLRPARVPRGLSLVIRPPRSHPSLSSPTHKKIGGKRVAPCRHRSQLRPHCSLPETSVVLKLVYCGSPIPGPSSTRFCGPSGAPAPGGGGPGRRNCPPAPGPRP